MDHAFISQSHNPYMRRSDVNPHTMLMKALNESGPFHLCLVRHSN